MGSKMVIITGKPNRDLWFCRDKCGITYNVDEREKCRERERGCGNTELEAFSFFIFGLSES